MNNTSEMVSLSVMYFSLLLTLLTPLSAWIVTVFVYRLVFHPLRKFPGPWLAAATDYYAGYFDLVKGGQLLSHIEKLHLKYGPVVRVGPNTLHFSEPQAFTDIYTYGTTFEKSKLVYDAMFHTEESCHAFMDPQKARTRRMMLNPLFSRRAILKLRHVVQGKVDRLISRIKDYPHGGPVDLASAFRSLTMDIITGYCFATSYDSLEHPTFRHPLILVVEQTLDNLWSRKYFTRLTRLSLATPIWIVKLINSNSNLLVYLRMRQEIESRIERYLEDESTLHAVEHETVFHHLILPENKDGSINRDLRPSKKSLVDEAFSLLGAGSDTVGNTCSTGTFFALNNPAISSRLKEELRQAWPDEDSTPDLDILEQLPYLTAFIKESLRFSHGVVTPLPRVVGPTDAKIGGFVVPAGTVVEMSCVFIHKNPTIFKDPETFSPDRWMGPGSKELETYLVPFSKGPRICLGINLAWCELYLILGTLFRKLDLNLYDNTIDDFKTFKELFVPVWEGKRLKVTVGQKV
ncbi:cytochrome P450 [Dendrothele bispora CBS 962.96]|uniref:Cytochrome P450 n=1 Tax=Dendrothele bispora (strain CBS 962.96) TaxID=1314807 RepID=A0A4S8M1G7_DENBC|nr:cytochrome P450 [Dendrothele bispora CBS 962.96]